VVDGVVVIVIAIRAALIIEIEAAVLAPIDRRGASDPQFRVFIDP